MTLECALSETPAAITGGLIAFRRYNLPGNPTTAQRQENMAPANRRDGADDPSQISSARPKNLREPRPSFFLRTKLLPPRPAPELLSRTPSDRPLVGQSCRIR